jgi:hypothetical protein
VLVRNGSNVARCKPYAFTDASKGNAVGFALVEALLATGLLALIIGTLYGAFSFGFRVIQVSQEDMRADQVLLERLESLRVYDWSRVTNHFIPGSFSAYYNNNTNGLSYAGTIVVTNTTFSESYAGTLRQVNASVTWVSGGVSRRRTMSTFVSQNGICTYKP